MGRCAAKFAAGSGVWPPGQGRMPQKITGTLMFVLNRCGGKGIALVGGLLLCGLSQAFSQTEAPQLVDPAQKAKTAPTEKSGAPINITAFGNKLIVTSEDPAALALVSELVRLLTSTKAGPGDFEIIRLKFANAV